MKLFGDALSGNCYKVMLLMHHLDIRHEWVAMDILAGDTGKADFLHNNPAGKIPLLMLDDGRCLPESNAILNYLATGSSYLPDDNWSRANVLKWQFFEQYSHEPYIAVARFIQLYLGLPEDRREEHEGLLPKGYKALDVLEETLSSHDWLVGNAMSIADISLYAYTHVAHQGGFDLSAYPGIRNWLARVSDHPRHLSMPEA